MFTKMRLIVAAIVVLTVAIMATVPAPTTSVVVSELAKPGEFVAAAPLQKGSPAQIISTSPFAKRLKIVNLSTKPIRQIQIGWVLTADYAAKRLAEQSPLLLKPVEVAINPASTQWVELEGVDLTEASKAGLKGGRISPGVMSVVFADGSGWSSVRIVENRDQRYRASLRPFLSPNRGSACKPPTVTVLQYLFGQTAAAQETKESTCVSGNGLLGYDCENGSPCNMTTCDDVYNCSNQKCSS